MTLDKQKQLRDAIVMAITAEHKLAVLDKLLEEYQKEVEYWKNSFYKQCEASRVLK